MYIEDLIALIEERIGPLDPDYLQAATVVLRRRLSILDNVIGNTSEPILIAYRAKVMKQLVADLSASE